MSKAVCFFNILYDTSAFTIVLNIIPADLNAWLLAGSLISAIILASSKTFIIWRNDYRDKRKN